LTYRLAGSHGNGDHVNRVFQSLFLGVRSWNLGRVPRRHPVHGLRGDEDKVQ